MVEALIFVHVFYWTIGSLVSMTVGAIVTYFVYYTATRMQ